MAFDVEGARKAGYSDAEIADHLAQQSGFDAAGARQAGYSDPEIVQHLSEANVPQQDKGTLATAASNIIPSAKRFGQAIAETVRHPMDTAKNLIDASVGVAQYLPTPLNYAMRAAEANGASYPAEARGKVEQIGQVYKDRYGGLENIRQTFMQDPVGMAADASTVLTGGGAALSKVPALARAGAIVSKAGQLVDPIAAAGKVVAPVLKPAGELAANLVGGLGTRTGAESVKQAFQAGREGGTKADAFLDNMRGNVPQTEVLDQARSAVENLRQERSAAYRQGMTGVTNDKTVLDFQPITDAFTNQVHIGSYKGKVLNRSAVETQQKLHDLVSDWAGSDPAEFHTPEGLDALKKAIGDVRDSTEFGSPSRKVADNLYNAVKNQITRQAPTYAKVMKGYEEASDQLKEIERSLSQGKNASADTALRKLQSVLRNNVNTNYGSRLQSVKALEGAGAPDLRASLAGQAMNVLTPRGLGAGMAAATGIGGIAMHAPIAIPLMAAQSPRLVGEAAYYAGKGTNALSKVPVARTANVLYQAQQPKKGKR